MADPGAPAHPNPELPALADGELFTKASHAMAILSLDSRMLAANPALREMFGMQPGEVLPYTCSEFIHPEDCAGREKLLREVVSGERDCFSLRLHFVRRSGEVLQACSTGMRIRGAGEEDYILCQFSDVTELEEAKSYAVMHRQRLMAFMDNAPQAMFAKDMEGRYILANRAFGELLGIDHLALPGKTVYDVLPAEHAGRVDENHRQVISSGKAVSKREEVTLHGRNGYFDVMNFPIRDGQGSTVGTAGITFDVTEAVRAERQARHEMRVNLALSEISQQIIGQEVTIPELADTVLGKALALTGSAHGYVSEMDEETGENVGHTLTHMLGDACRVTGPDARIAFPPGPDGTYPGLFGCTLNTGKSFFTNDPASHPASTGVPDGHVPLENFLSVAAMLNGRLVGQIALANKSGGYRARDLDTVKQLAALYALALEKKQQLAAIVDSGRLYGNMFHNNNAIKLLIDPETGQIVDANSAARRFYGYSEEQFRQLTIQDINQLPPDEVQERMQQASASERLDFVFPHKLADGTIRLVEVHSGAVQHQGRELLFSILFDVTEREEAQADRERLIEELSHTLAKVKTLSGLLPICSSCKKIRDDTGYWQQLEEYIGTHSGAEFTHGICPDCAKELYPELVDKLKGKG